MTYRLISKERDYYDYSFHVYPPDPKKIFKRKMSTVDITRKEITELFRDKDVYAAFKPRAPEYYIGVCGKWYRCVEHKDKFILTGYHHDKVPFDEVFEHSEYYQGQSSYYKKHNKSHRYNSALKAYQGKIDVVNHDLFVKYDAAVLGLRVGWMHQYDELTIYPVLKNYGFSAVMAPEIIHQEIEMYLESTLSKYEEIGCIPNENKILSAGFDLKQSFRHRK